MRKVLLIAVGLALVGCGQSEAEKAKSKKEMTEIKVNRIGKERVIAKLKDGGSAKFQNQVAFCGEVNAKNSFGAYTGFKRYIAASDELVVMEDNMDPKEFDDAWREYCVSYAK
ncbi:hypothetical protein [Acinetobacter larvae]|uniref:Lipoprotein n=1 Tax=Acinetobacter larvae TaxID=1789224 RepID=A0A1B2LZN0_9GAMM|nr:hypothetical protein [Acinetobacter larvae]AOA58233.1 hypothetical protein BFG52_07620 [Acinetobacter larvae]